MGSRWQDDPQLQLLDAFFQSDDPDEEKKIMLDPTFPIRSGASSSTAYVRPFVDGEASWSEVDISWSEIYSFLNLDPSSPSRSHFDLLALSSDLPILLNSRNTFPSPHASRLSIWQCGVMNYFGVPDNEPANRRDDQSIRVSTSGGLLYRYYPHKYSSIATMEICNPITKGYRRLALPQDGPHDPGNDHCVRRDRRFLVWGIIVENRVNRYQVIVQNWTVSGEATISQLLVYDSASDMWETIVELPQDICSRVGDYIYSSTSSGGNLYFLTRCEDARLLDARNRPRLIKYDGKDKSIREIFPLPKFIGRGEPVLLEHKSCIIFLTRKRVQRDYVCKNSWVFFRLEDRSNAFTKMKVMPPDEFETLCRNMKTVRCCGSGDSVYFFGKPSSKTRIMRVLVHDLVKDSWTWLPDFLRPENIGENTWSWDLVFPVS